MINDCESHTLIHFLISLVTTFRNVTFLPLNIHLSHLTPLELSFEMGTVFRNFWIARFSKAYFVGSEALYYGDLINLRFGI